MNSDMSRAYCVFMISGPNMNSNVITSRYIWMNSRLKEISIESKNTRNGVRTKKLWLSEVGGQQSEK